LAVLFLLSIIGLVAVIIVRKRQNQNGDHQLLFGEEEIQPNDPVDSE